MQDVLATEAQDNFRFALVAVDRASLLEGLSFLK